MAYFLNTQELYRLIQRELPEGVYADGAPSGFFTTADSYATAKAIASLYANLQLIDANNFPQSAEDRLGDWAIKAFGYDFDATSLAEKRERIIAKIRKQPKINMWEILTLVAGYLPEGTYVQVYSPCTGNSNWELGISMLGVDTFLRGVTFESLGIEASQWCEEVANLHWRLGYDQLGVNTFLSEFLYTDIAAIQAQSYLYEIRIFGYTLNATLLAQMNIEINRAEPARSSHRIAQGLNLNDFGLTNTVNNVDEFSLVDCIARDSSSTTGYTGLTT